MVITVAVTRCLLKMFHPQPGLEEEQLSRDVKHNRDWRISLQALQWGYEQVKEEEEEEGEGCEG